MAKVKFLLLLLIALILVSSIVVAQPLGLKENIPEGALRVVEKYMMSLGKSRLEEVDRLGNNTFLFVARVKSEEVGGEDTVHYIITTRYLEYKIIYDSTELIAG